MPAVLGNLVKAARRRLPLTTRRRLAVFVGGMLGTALRALVVAAVPVGASGWPWATFSANVTGALLLGYLLTRFLNAATRTTLAVPLLCTGVLGSYTTFSSFAVEVTDLLKFGRINTALGYGLGSVIVGYAAAQLGRRGAERRG